jgi:phosphate transport system substrate-binding protein
MIRHLFLALAATAVLTAGCSKGGNQAPAAQGPKISGAGATFPAPLYAKWAEAAKSATGLTLNYQAIGSGGGIKQIEAGTVAFGASDKPLKPADLEKNGLLQFPTVMGGVVPVANLPGVAPGAIKLTGPVLADIYLGKVKTWADPEVAQVNAGMKLPNLPITVVHRADGSGTSFLFTSYLTGVAPAWAKVGASDSVAWPAGIGGKGNDGVAVLVKQTPGAIGYVEYAYAKQNGMTYTLLQNASGAFVAPTAASFAAAAAGADWANAPGFYLLLLNQPGKDAWPITGATFILMHRRQTDPAQAATVLSFFDWAYKNGDAQALALDYVPLPEPVKALVRQSWVGIVGPDGKPVYTPAS